MGASRKGKWLLTGAASLLAAAALVYTAIDFDGARTFFVRGLRAAAFFLPQVAGMLGIGWKSLALLGWEERDGARGTIFSIALGLGIIAHLFLILGLAGLLYPVTAWIVFFALAGIGLAHFWARRSATRELLNAAGRRLDGLSALSAAGLVVLAVSLVYPLLADAFVPPLEYDEIAYHLPTAQLFIDSHRIRFIPFIPHTNWPVGFELIFLFQLLLTTDVLAHLMTYLTYLLTVGAATVYVYREAGGRGALFAALLIAGIPTYLNLSGTGMVDVPVAMFTFFAVLAWLEWLRGEANSALALSAVFAGFAASLKLNAALFAVVLGLAVLVRQLALGRTRAAIAALVRYGLISAAVVLPWYLKSWIVAGNPFWPFLPEIFGARHWDAIAQGYLMEFIRAPNRPLTLLNWVTGFADLAIHPERYGPVFRVGPNLLLFSPAIVLAFLIKPAQRIQILSLGGIFLGLYTIWFLTTHQNRFFLPAVPVFAALVGLGVGFLLTHRNTVLRLFLFPALLVYFAAGLWVFDGEVRAKVAENWGYQTGKISRNEYLRSKLAIYEAVEYLNANTQPDAYVLMALYEPRGYYLEREYFWLNPVAQRLIEIETYPSAAAFREDLLDRGFTHVLYNPNWPPELDEISARYNPILLEVLAQSSEVFAARGISVYALSGSE